MLLPTLLQFYRNKTFYKNESRPVFEFWLCKYRKSVKQWFFSNRLGLDFKKDTLTELFRRLICKNTNYINMSTQVQYTNPSSSSRGTGRCEFNLSAGWDNFIFVKQSVFKSYLENLQTGSSRRIFSF